MNDKLRVVLDATILAVVTALLSTYLGIWNELYTRGDTAAHMTKVKHILDYWPHIRWSHQWAFGLPLFLWYAPLPYIILAMISLLTGSIETAFSLSATSSLYIIALSLYFIILRQTEDNSASLVSALLFLFSPASWVYTLKDGLYPRLIAMVFLPLSIYFYLKFKEHPNRKNYVAFIFILALGLQAHLLIGLITGLTILFFIFFTVNGVRKKLTTTAKIFLPAIALSSYFYLPFFLTQPARRFLGIAVSSPPLPFQHMVFDTDLPPYDGEVLFPVIAPTLIVLLILLYLRNFKVTSNVRGVSKAVFSMTLLFILFAFIGHFGWPSTWYINGFPPGEATIFLSLLMPFIIGILLGSLFSATSQRRRKTLSAFMVCGILIAAVLVYLPISTNELSWISRADNPVIKITMKNITADPSEFNYRFGTDWDRIGMWFNYKYSIPQTREYYGQGILVEDWKFWFEKTVWVDLDNYNETNYALNWFAVKWISISYPHYHYNKFLSKPEFYKKIVEVYEPLVESLHEFVYVNASPIISARNTPTLLIIGDESGYGNIFQALSSLNYNSEYIIPVQGGKFIEDYTLNELKLFDAVFLYGYQFRDRDRAYSLLREYVEAGGGLIIDTGYSPEASSKNFPDPFPASETMATDFGRIWSFTSIDSPVTTGIKFERFSPAIYGVSAPWGMSVSANETIKKWATPVLWNHGHPVIILGEFKKGRVLWSGINLPYHIANYMNPEETKLLIKMIEWALGKREPSNENVRHVVERKNPEIVRITIHDYSRGILFKESYIKNWKAYLTDKDGKRYSLNIYEAGPSFMYIPIGMKHNYPIEILLVYDLSLEEWMGALLSILTLASLIIYGFSPSSRYRKPSIQNA